MQKNITIRHSKHHSSHKRSALSQRCVYKRPKKVRITPCKAIATTTRKKRTANVGELFKNISAFLKAIFPIVKTVLEFISKTNIK